MTANWRKSKIPHNVSCDPILHCVDEIAACILNGLSCRPDAIQFRNLDKIWLFTIIDELVLCFFQSSLNIF